jgi:hypothetical protein
MSNKKKIPPFQPQKHLSKPIFPTSNTMLDKMVDGIEFESILGYQYVDFDFVNELRKSILEIKAIRHNPVVCYVANVVKQTSGSISIDDSDDLPFNEMIASLPSDVKEIDIVLVTPGGIAQQVAKFVNKLRPRFEKVSFILLNKAMSAGTILISSGDEIVMTSQSQIGPVDPQVRMKNGEFVPAQAILTLIDDIRKRGEAALKINQQPAWTDLQLLKNMDAKEIGNALSASNYSIQMVEQYLYNYKFKFWNIHSDLITPVSDDEKKARANEIANMLCDHSKWKNHGHAITREAAWDVCKLKIIHSEDVEGLDRAMRRMWTIYYWLFENFPITKFFLSENYCIIRRDSNGDKK